MTNFQNVANGQIYSLYWAVYANARPELVAIPKTVSMNIVHNANRMDYVTVSPEAIKSINEIPSTRMDP